MATGRVIKYITETEAREILAPYLEMLAQAIERAWQRWWEQPARDRKAASTRTRATYVYDLICDEIRAQFENQPQLDVSIHETRHHMLWLNIEGRLVIRFKKLDNLKLGSNIATRFQTEFTLQLELPDLPPEAARLVVGYQLDRSQSKITDILVTYRIGDRVEWFFSAREGGSSSAAFPAPLPFPTIPVVPVAPAKSRVGPKKPRKDAEKVSEDKRKTSDQ